MLHHLITEAEIKMALGELDTIACLVNMSQSFCNAGVWHVALVPVIFAMPPIDDVNPVGVVSSLKQDFDRLPDAAAEIENARTGPHRYSKPFDKAQMALDRSDLLIVAVGEDCAGRDAMERSTRTSRSMRHRKQFPVRWGQLVSRRLGLPLVASSPWDASQHDLG